MNLAGMLRWGFLFTTVMLTTACTVPTHASPEKPMPNIHNLSDFVFDQHLSRDEVTEKWGSGLRYGPAKEMLVYEIGDNKIVWLTFSADKEMLQRALLFNTQNQASYERELFNNIAVVGSRDCKDLPVPADLTPDALLKAWGSPDGEAGSGLQYWNYRLADGKAVAISFSMDVPIISGCR